MFGFFSSSVSFDAKKDIPDLSGKVILVTGANNGLGKQSVLDFARHSPSAIWLAARDAKKAQAAVDDIKKEVPGAKINILQLDLSSFESVRQAAAEFRAASDRLDILMLNAGIMAAPIGRTKEGYEVQFGTNHMGHALLTRLLLPTLEKTAAQPGADVRVVVLSSAIHHSVGVKGSIDFDSLKTDGAAIGPWALYGQSKSANVLFARHLARLYPQFTVTSIHPGVVRTGLVSSANGAGAAVQALGALVGKLGLLTTVEQGARNQLWAATATKGIESGEYYEPVGVPNRISADGKNPELAEKLWNWTQKELDPHVA